MRILGIDPGLRITGYGCVEGECDDLRLVEAGVFRLTGGVARGSSRGVAINGDDPGGVPDDGESAEPDAGDALPAARPTGVRSAGVRSAGARSAGRARAVSARLLELDNDLSGLIDRLRPDLAAVEILFAHYKHPATAIVMGHARGVILLALARRRIPLIEVRPNEVKKSLTGNGHASKDQMQLGVQRHFGLAEPPSPPDVADAIAIAVCAARRRATVEAIEGSTGRAQGGAGLLRIRTG
jgi:crossover junction endodeoxyribonuclease RuvC